MASIYDSWMCGLRREDDDAARLQKQAALVSYLNGTITADEVVHEWTKQLTDSENCSAELPWGLVIDAAEEFPQAQHKLVELLDVVAQLPTAGEGNAGKLRLNISELMFDLRDAFSGIESASLSSHSTTTDEHHYINLCAFIARVWHHQHEDWTNWAMQLSYDGLEDEHRKPLANLFGQAVAQLFLFSGPEMYASSNATQSSEYCVGPLLLKEREIARVSRWEFWKRRFGQLQGSELLSDETRELFSKALESMAEVEVEMERRSNEYGAREAAVVQG